MARRSLLGENDRRRVFGIPCDDTDLIRYYTLSVDDIEICSGRHGDANRLGFAIQLCLLRYPGFGFRPDEVLPDGLLVYVAHQLSVPPRSFRPGAIMLRSLPAC